eukprot:g3240.t1
MVWCGTAKRHTKTRVDTAAKFARLGFRDVEPTDIITSGYSTARYLADELGLPRARRPRALVVGTPALVAELELAGIDCTPAPDGALDADSFSALEPDPAVGAVVIGNDPQLSYARLAHAALALQDDKVVFVATNADAADNVGTASRPRLMPGAGTVVGALRGCTGREPFVCGKGFEWMPRFVRDVAAIDGGGGGGDGDDGGAAVSVAMVGDRMETDIVFGRQCGFLTVLPMTGVTTEDMLLAAQATAAAAGNAGANVMCIPHHVIESVACLKS